MYLSTLSSLFLITDVAHMFGLLLSTVKVVHKFWQKGVGLHFGPLLHNLTWSPCFQRHQFVLT
jgi:hypothetical protein